MTTLRSKFLLPALLCSLLLPLFAAPAGEAKRVLNIYTWEDYFDPEAVRLFEEKHDCRVEFDYYDSNETMFESLHGNDGYDLITPPPNVAVQLNDDGWLLPLDHALLPNRKYLDRSSPSMSHDPDMKFSVPYTFTVTGVGYNKQMVPPDALGSWAIFADKRFHKRMAMLNDMRETIGAGLKFLGHSLNSVAPAEVAAAGKVVEGWKGNLTMFDVDHAREGLRSGTLAAIQAYNGDIAMISSGRDDDDIAFFVPKEGSALNADVFVIPSDTTDADLAYAFINHFLDPEMAAKNMESIHYYMPNPEALSRLGAELREHGAFNIPRDIIDKCEVVRNLDSAKRTLYDQAWSKVLLAE